MLELYHMSEFLKKLGAWGGIFGGIQFIIITFGIMIIYPEGYELDNYYHRSMS